jgi:hypothetical protein
MKRQMKRQLKPYKVKLEYHSDITIDIDEAFSEEDAIKQAREQMTCSHIGLNAYTYDESAEEV